MPPRQATVRLLSYDVSLVPQGGNEVLCGTASLLKVAKEPAGKCFHLFALKQAGLFGKSEASQRALAWTSRETAEQHLALSLLACVDSRTGRGGGAGRAAPVPGVHGIVPEREFR